MLTLVPRIDDLVVIGGGVMGLCAAAEVKRRSPEASVTIVDRGSIGGGASAHAPGIQLAIGRTPRERDLTVRSLRAWRRMVSEERWTIGRTCALYWLADDVASLREMHVEGGPNGASAEVLASRLTSLSMKTHDRAILEDRCSYSPVALVMRALRRRLAIAGCRFVEDFEATHWEADGSNVHVHRRRGSAISARNAVVALGPWAPKSPLMAAATGPSLPLRVKKVVSLHLARVPTPECPAIAFQEDYAFLVPMVENGYWLFSFASDHWDVDPIAETLHVEPADLDKAQSILAKWFPEVPAVASARVFCDCYSGDRTPFVSLAKEASNVAFIGAGGGNGFRFAPACAEDAVDMLDYFARA